MKSDQEVRVATALTTAFADTAQFDATLDRAGKQNRAAQVIEIGDQDQLGDIGRSKAFAAFREQVLAARPDVADVRGVTVKHFRQFGFESRAAAAFYLKEPTPLRRAAVWFFDCGR
jgi:hypothetical protein